MAGRTEPRSGKENIDGEETGGSPGNAGSHECQLPGKRTGPIDFLKRDDTRALLLSADEVAPWLREIEERFSKMPIFAELRPDQPPAENIKKELCDLFWNVSIEMAQAIFTPSRLKQLKEQLHDYHRRLLADGDQKAVMAVHGALMAASPTTAVKDQPFLTALCYTSLYTVIQNMRKSSFKQ